MQSLLSRSGRSFFYEIARNIALGTPITSDRSTRNVFWPLGLVAVHGDCRFQQNITVSGSRRTDGRTDGFLEMM
jgi:hypothetical protein